MAGFDRSSVDPDEGPFLVFPQGVGLPSLEAAGEFCASRKNKPTGKGQRQWSYILVPPGFHMLQNSYTIPDDTILVGWAGYAATFVLAQASMTDPTIRVSPPAGPTEVGYGLTGLTIMNQNAAAVSFSGTNASSELWIEGCLLESPVGPAIKMTGQGYPGGEEFGLEIIHSDVNSENGLAIDADLGDNSDIYGYDSSMTGGQGAMDIDASTATPDQVYVELLRCDLEAEENALFGVQAVGVNRLNLWRTHIWAGTGDALILQHSGSGGIQGDIYYCDFWADKGDGIDISGPAYAEIFYTQVQAWTNTACGLRAHNQAIVNMYYSGLRAITPYDVDGTSILTQRYCH